MQSKTGFLIKNIPSRPESRSNFLPDIMQTPQNQNKKNNTNNQIFTQRGMDTLNFHKKSLIEIQSETLTARNNPRTEMIRDMFKQDKKPTLKPIIKQDNSQRTTFLVRFDDPPTQSQSIVYQLPKSILKRKSSNSREHSDILDFFEINEDPKLEKMEKLKNSKHISLQPIQPITQQTITQNKLYHSIQPESVSPNKKVKFNKQIQIKVIDPAKEEQEQKQEIDKSKIRHRNYNRQYTVADLNLTENY